MKKLLLLSLSLVVSLSLFSQSLLWKISGKGIKEPSYLFGTIHISDERVFAFDSTLYHALNSSDALALEMVMDQIKREDIENNMLMKKHNLKDLFTDEEWDIVQKRFQEKTGSPIILFNKMKPFFVYSQLMQSSMKQDRPEALDMYLLKIFREAGKPVLGIEDLSDQLKAIDQITLHEQAQMLYKGLEDTSATNNQYEGLIEIYISQKLPKMLDLMVDTAMPKKFNQAFLIDRNIKMAKNILNFSKKQSTFNAVGAAHLPGEKGIIELLRKRGVIVEPVTIVFKTAEN